MERCGRSGGGGSRRDNGDGDNDDDGDIEYNSKDGEGDDGGGGSRFISNCNGNVRSADSGMRRLGKGLIPSPAASDNLPLLLSPFFSPTSVPAFSFLTTADAEEGGEGVIGAVLVGGGSVVS